MFFSFSVQSQSWVPFGSPNNFVKSIEVHNGELYVAGKFDEIGPIVSRVAKWDGTSWTNVGNGFSNSWSMAVVSDLHSNNGVLYAVCDNVLYYLDGNNWVDLNFSISSENKICSYGTGIIFNGNGGVGSSVYTGNVGNFNIFSTGGGGKVFKEFNGDLYAGGGGLYKWDGSSWNDITGSVSGGNFEINGLEVYQNKLLIVGNFGSIGGILAESIAFYDGVNYSTVGNPTLDQYTGSSSPFIEGVLLQGNQFYIFGSVWAPTFISYLSLIRFDGSNWDYTASFGQSAANDFEIYNSDLFCGGYFTGMNGNYLWRHIGIPLSINDYNELSNLNIFPNPTQDQITLEIEGYNGPVNVELYDLQGRLLETTKNNTISMGEYDKGIYVFKVNYGDVSEEVRVVRD
tara:strand:+ start:166 stop:1365 length:1200 start_codon:yes stop_codon:yes gene_type:complete